MSYFAYHNWHPVDALSTINKEKFNYIEHLFGQVAPQSFNAMLTIASIITTSKSDSLSAVGSIFYLSLISDIFTGLRRIRQQVTNGKLFRTLSSLGTIFSMIGGGFALAYHDDDNTLRATTVLAVLATFSNMTWDILANFQENTFSKQNKWLSISLFISYIVTLGSLTITNLNEDETKSGNTLGILTIISFYASVLVSTITHGISCAIKPYDETRFAINLAAYSQENSENYEIKKSYSYEIAPGYIVKGCGYFVDCCGSGKELHAGRDTKGTWHNKFNIGIAILAATIGSLGLFLPSLSREDSVAMISSALFFANSLQSSLDFHRTLVKETNTFINTVRPIHNP